MLFIKESIYVKKMGRPKKENSRCNKITIRLDDSEYDDVLKYCSKTKQNFTEVLRKALKSLIG